MFTYKGIKMVDKRTVYLFDVLYAYTHTHTPLYDKMLYQGD